MMAGFGAIAKEYEADYENFRTGDGLIAFRKVPLLRIEMSKENINKMRKTFLLAGMPTKFNCWTANRFDSIFEYLEHAWDFSLEFRPKDDVSAAFNMYYKRSESNHLGPMIAF